MRIQIIRIKYDFWSPKTATIWSADDYDEDVKRRWIYKVVTALAFEFFLLFFYSLSSRPYYA